MFNVECPVTSYPLMMLVIVVDHSPVHRAECCTFQRISYTRWHAQLACRSVTMNTSPEDAGSLTPEAVLQTVLEIGVAVPQAVATEAGGTSRRNKINPYTVYFNHAV